MATKPLYQLLFPLPQSCSHMVVSHDTPKSAVDLYDNASLLLETISGLFEVLSDAAPDNDSTKSVLRLGVDLCAELERRIQLLYRAHEVLAEGQEPEIAPAEAGGKKG